MSEMLENPRMDRTITLTAGTARLAVQPDHGGRIAGFELDGRALLHASANPLLTGSYPMAPWAGRIRHGRFSFGGVDHRLRIGAAPHALHGTVHDTRWEVVAAMADRCSMRCALDHDGNWPLGGYVEQHIALDEQRMTCVLSVTATTQPFPAVVGWHPCFVAPTSASLGFARQYARDADGITVDRLVSPPPLPWPDRVCDDCFIDPTGPLTLHYRDLDLTIVSDCDHWVVYDGADGVLCVEPQSGPPDAVNLGRAAVIGPGETLERRMSWQWAAAPPATGR